MTDLDDWGVPCSHDRIYADTHKAVLMGCCLNPTCGRLFGVATGMLDGEMVVWRRRNGNAKLREDVPAAGYYIRAGENWVRAAEITTAAKDMADGA